ncbi:VWA domain-containing protein [Corynebacterium sp. TAE3-ERU12]|uniref:VWA domain-containing protein n=1 Tax=Corynebacterium sp. TAE3-ERU12 TaxID=2849491 RepID=UPI001C461A3A|nr:VWA domain-containing protein [Corynebacterium sp. TAE3-ERU12]MBV7295443.1 VWA domain-containing protein [Corynebacterium sp. TAE3-ERU12]
MFAHPYWLVAAVIPLIAAAVYAVVVRRSRRRAIAFSNTFALQQVLQSTTNWTRHIPVIAMVVALVLACIALAEPITEKKVARNRATVILVVDVSLSMGAKDVAPSRVVAAKEAGKKFIETMPDDLNLGLVTFAGSTRTPVSPTTDHGRVARALDAATLANATATGDAIMAALDAVAEVEDTIGGAEGPPPAAIILLSDGEQTIPAELDDPRGAYTAAEEAAERGVPVNTISFGTPDGAVEVQGERIPVPTDDVSLQQIAERTDGTFNKAESLDELNDAYGELADDIGYEMRQEPNPRPWLLAAFWVLVIAVGAEVFESRRSPGH